MAKIDVVIANQINTQVALRDLTEAFNNHTQKMNEICETTAKNEVRIDYLAKKVEVLCNHKHEGMEVSINDLQKHSDNNDRLTALFSFVGMIISAVFGWRMPNN